MTRNVLLLGVVGAMIVGLAWRFFIAGTDVHSTHAGAGPAEMKIPTLSDLATAGKGIFDANCAACHGQNAAGVDGAGPPLVHIIYEPSHHADITFYMAVKQGVRAHHWRFGDMPPVSGVGDGDVSKIIAYVRELQRANGID